nr:RecName: Full=Unknown protein 3 [Capsicum chinense]
GEVFAFPR